MRVIWRVIRRAGGEEPTLSGSGLAGFVDWPLPGADSASSFIRVYVPPIRGVGEVKLGQLCEWFADGSQVATAKAPAWRREERP